MKHKNSILQQGLGILCMMLLLVFSAGAPLAAQDQEQGSSQPPAPPAQQFSPDQLNAMVCLLYTSPSPRDVEESRMPSSA